MMLSLLRRRVTLPQARNIAGSFSVAAAAYAATAGWSLRLWIPGGGVPSFRHDWIWPVLQQQVGSIPHLIFSAWVDQGLGFPSWNPSFYPSMCLIWSLSGIAGVHWAPIVFVLTAVVGSALALRVLAISYGASRFGAFCGGLAYGFGPALFTKLVAGHYQFTIVFAGLPLLALGVRLTRLTRLRSGTILTALGAAMCGAMVQYQVLLAVAAIIGIRWLIPWRSSLSILAVLALTQAATLFALLHPSIVATLESQRALLPWEINLSSSMGSAIRTIGYFMHYAEDVSPHWWPASLYFPVALGIWGLLRRRLAGMIALLAFGVALVAGLRGPLAVPLRYMFCKFTAASAFREFAHFWPLVALPISLGIAFSVYSGSQRPLSRALALTSACLYAVPFLGGGLTTLVKEYAPSRDVRQAAGIMERDKVPGRFMVVPFEQPVRRKGSSSAGIDALSYYPIGRQQPFFTYLPTGPIAFVDALLRDGSTAFSSVAARMGVRYVVVRRDVVSQSAGPVDERMLRALRTTRVVFEGPHVTLYRIDADAPEVATAPLPLLVDGDMWNLARYPGINVIFARQLFGEVPPPIVGGIVSSRGQDVSLLLRGATLKEPHPNYAVSSPRQGWVLADRYYYARPQLTGSLLPAVFRDSNEKIFAHYALVHESRWDGYRWVRGPALSSSLAGIATAANARPARPFVVKTSRYPMMRRVRSSIVVSPSRLPFLLILNKNYNSGWKLAPRESAIGPFPVNGFSNGWILGPSRFRRSLHLYYKASSVFRLLFTTAGLAWLTIFMAVASNLRRIKDDVRKASGVGNPSRADFSTT